MLGLFLGAGASYEVGMPLVMELSNEVRHNVVKRLDKKLFNFNAFPHLKLIFKNLLLCEVLNYEQVLGELENLFLKEIKHQQEIWGLINQFIECVHLILLEDQKNTLELFHQKVRDYGGIVSVVQNNAPLYVFSLNHDIVFEEICGYYKIPLKDGFYDQDTKYKNIANFKILKKQDIENEKLNFYCQGEVGVNLLKLHGSFDIFAANDKEIFLKSYGDENKFGSHYKEIEKIENHSSLINARDQLRMVNELQVYDDENEIQFLRRSLLSGEHKFKGSFEQIVPVGFLRLFQKKINEISKLVVIGYSFGDSHINDIICDWLTHEDRTLTIYDPFRKESPEFLYSYCNKIEIINGGLTDYLVSCGTPITTLEENNIHINSEIRNNLRTRRLLMESLETEKVAT